MSGEQELLGLFGKLLYLTPEEKDCTRFSDINLARMRITGQYAVYRQRVSGDYFELHFSHWRPEDGKVLIPSWPKLFKYLERDATITLSRITLSRQRYNRGQVWVLLRPAIRSFDPEKLLDQYIDSVRDGYSLEARFLKEYLLSKGLDTPAKLDKLHMSISAARKLL